MSDDNLTDLQKLELRVERLEHKFAIMQAESQDSPLKPQQPIWPMNPMEPGTEYNANRCHICDIEFTSTMGYSCPRTDCPSAITCGSSSLTSNY